jgi:hypothetical protein
MPKSAHLHRAFAEVVRIHQRRQRQHVGTVRLVQRDDVGSVGHVQRRGARHLCEIVEGLERPARRHVRRRDTEQVHALTRRDQGRFAVRRDMDIAVRMRDPQEWRVSRGVARDIADPQGDIAMPRGERRPEWVVERVRIHGRARFSPRA